MAIQDLGQAKADFFKKRREQVGQEADVATQEASDALTRRFAALGAQGSGAAIGAQLKAKEMGAKQKQAGMEQVGAEELQSNIQEAEAEKGRQFQREMAGQDLDLKKEMFGFEKQTKLGELDLAKRQFDLDTATTDFNKRLALAQAGIQKFDLPVENIQRTGGATSQQPSAPTSGTQQGAETKVLAPGVKDFGGGLKLNLDQWAQDLYGNTFENLPPASRQNIMARAISLQMASRGTDIFGNQQQINPEAQRLLKKYGV